MRDQNFIGKEMKKTMLKIFLLRRIAKTKTNSYTLLKEMSKRFSSRFFDSKEQIKNEIYNTINSLEKSGYIKSSKRVENGRAKNYYVLTLSGKHVVLSARMLFRKHLKALDALMNK